MATRLFVSGRRTIRPVIWEAWEVTLQVQTGLGHEKVTFEEPIICVSGSFKLAFAAAKFPGYPVFDPNDITIERTRIYQGRNYPSDFVLENETNPLNTRTMARR